MSEAIVNRRAYFDYEILDTYEAGIVLHGFEVKAAKKGMINLIGAFVVIRGGEAWLLNATISPYQAGNIPKDYDPMRSRKLLLKKVEISELVGFSSKQGLTLIPLRLYNKRNLVKILIGVGKHKKKSDKRETIKKRDTEREVRRTLRQ